ncbi:Transcriptional regulator, TetR family [Corynebacterium endometrii]|uniref:Transcriptional regulator, TetR family n=2 Tax=Corynebacterium endometrii TaxID=2488819 RepID=A0A4P7QG03_9CORY|nr:Transcriptional regulator, TetR family [Corynebacterium endometrii]
MRAIVDAAEEIVQVGGAEALTVGAVADRVGLARNSLYRYVKSLDQLRGMVMERHVPEMFGTILRAVREAEDPEVALEAYVRTNLLIAADGRNVWLMELAEGLTGKLPERITELYVTLMREITAVLRHFDPETALFTGEMVNSVVVAGFTAVERGDDPELINSRCCDAVLAIARQRAAVAPAS